MKLMAAALLMLTLEACGGRTIPLEAPPARLHAELQRDRDSLVKTSNPVSRAKILIRISDALLGLVRHSAATGDIVAMKYSLNQYTDALEDGQKVMQETGRNARSKSAGFMDLELAMRRQLRELEDIGATLTANERDPVNQAITNVSGIRDSMLEALMGGLNAPQNH
ncbi:MAG TPA: hypothetical protein VFY29_11420 [Terriglobia bacterium]|nr:hypothetical protein [Terriglobia bacterium]